MKTIEQKNKKSCFSLQARIYKERRKNSGIKDTGNEMTTIKGNGWAMNM